MEDLRVLSHRGCRSTISSSYSKTEKKAVEGGIPEGIERDAGDAVVEQGETRTKVFLTGAQLEEEESNDQRRDHLPLIRAIFCVSRTFLRLCKNRSRWHIC